MKANLAALVNTTAAHVLFAEKTGTAQTRLAPKVGLMRMPVIDSTAVCREYLESLTTRAFDRDGFGTLCTFLRVSGLHAAYWDPLEESRRAFSDFNWVLEQVYEQRGEVSARRIRLLMYCQALEMSAANEMLVNLVRVASGQPYIVRPLGNLSQPKRKGTPGSIPPSAKRQFTEMSKLAKQYRETQLVDLIDSFFDEDVRNAFSHSDYIFGDTFFRWTRGGRPEDVPLVELDTRIGNCFAFYGSLLSLQTYWLTSIANGKRFHKWPNYEVLELLSSEADGGVYGFHVHFSNGSKASFNRRRSGVEAINMFFERNGEVSFDVGMLDALEPVYKVNGVPVNVWESLEKQDVDEARA